MSMLRGLMPARVRSNAGCWTCRLRRKKCDERRPECEACHTLEITCYFGDDKPDWMDGGPKQKEMADKIKSQVKKQASQRRDRKYMELLEAGTRNMAMEKGQPNGGDMKNGSVANNVNGNAQLNSKASRNTLGNQQPAHDERMRNGGHSDTDPGPGSHSGTADNGLTPPSSYTTGGSPPEIAWTSPIFHRQMANEDGGPDIDVHFVMIFLDYVFPYLFPYYRPTILGGGRGWVLDVIQQNKAVYYTAISMGAYFFGILLANGNMDHKECTDRLANKLQGQLENGLRELQKEMKNMNSRHGDSDPYEQLSLIQSITQMAVFEVATSNGGNWKIHLDASIALFNQLLPKPEQWTQVLHGFYTPKWPPPSLGIKRPWSTNQAALRFFAANLIYMDIMSSVSLERAPRLRAYQESIIPGCYSSECRENAMTAGPIFLDEFFGLHNWLVQMIGDVATLDAWKKEQMQAGTLTPAELWGRGQTLADALQASVQSMHTVINNKPLDPVQQVFARIVEDPLPGVRTHPSSSDTEALHPAMAVHNKIWMHAVLAYLYVVIFGWQPEHPDIKFHADSVAAELDALPPGGYLRGVAFPFCIAGCLAPAEDEEKFRAMLRRLGPLQVFGTIKEASEIQEKVWACRDHLDESWDVAKCLRILGHRSLLI